MKQSTVEKICNAWNMFNDDDISTERLLEMVRQECNLQDVSDVITGLIKGGILTQPERLDDD